MVYAKWCLKTDSGDDTEPSHVPGDDEKPGSSHVQPWGCWY